LEYFQGNVINLSVIYRKLAILLAVGDVETYGKSKNEVTLAVSK
jgi:hypothetical protein